VYVTGLNLEWSAHLIPARRSSESRHSELVALRPTVRLSSVAERPLPIELSFYINHVLYVVSILLQYSLIVIFTSLQSDSLYAINSSISVAAVSVRLK